MMIMVIAMIMPLKDDSIFIECRKRNLAYKLITDIPHVTCPKPTGAFYLLPDVSHYYNKRLPRVSSSSSSDDDGDMLRDSHELCLALLRREAVAVVSGDAFGAPRCLRLSYATSLHVISEALTRLKSFLLALEDV